MASLFLILQLCTKIFSETVAINTMILWPPTVPLLTLHCAVLFSAKVMFLSSQTKPVLTALQAKQKKNKATQAKPPLQKNMQTACRLLPLQKSILTTAILLTNVFRFGALYRLLKASVQNRCPNFSLSSASCRWKQNCGVSLPGLAMFWELLNTNFSNEYNPLVSII